MMRITEIHIHPVIPQNGLVAFVNLVIDDALFLGSIAVHEKRDGSGYRLTYPTKGKGYLFHPTRPHLSRALEDRIFAEMKTVMGKRDAGHRGVKP